MRGRIIDTDSRKDADLGHTLSVYRSSSGYFLCLSGGCGLAKRAACPPLPVAPEPEPAGLFHAAVQPAARRLLFAPPYCSRFVVMLALVALRWEV